MFSVTDAEAIKSKGTSNPITLSSLVCGNSLCDRPMSMEEKIQMYLKEDNSGSSVVQKSFGGILQHPDAPAQTPSGTDILLTVDSGFPGCEVTDSCFSPSSFNILVGDSVTWYNGDTHPHTITAGDGIQIDNLFGMDDAPKFDSGLLEHYESFSHKFTEAGKYAYYCFFHPWMVGEIIVHEPSTQTTIEEEHEHSTQTMIEEEHEPIPKWMKSVEKWVEQGLVSNHDFENAMKFLDKKGYLKSDHH